DRDEATAGIRRGNADRDLFAGVVLRSLELHLQLGVFVERAFHRAAADDRKTNAAYFALSAVAHLNHVIARFVRRELIFQSIRANRDLLGFRDAFFQHRLVAVAAVFFLR